MRVLFDTSVVVAALVEAHPMHPRAFPWLQRSRDRKIDSVIATHSIAEAHAVLSSLPISRRVAPSAAWALLEHSVLPYAQTVDLSASDVREVVGLRSRQGMTGAIVHDALVAAAAAKGGADSILTLNADDFVRVADSTKPEVRSP